MWFYIDDDKLREREEEAREMNDKAKLIASFGAGMLVTMVILGGTFVYQVKFGNLTENICFINDIVNDDDRSIFNVWK